jgi:hypothetical protein
MPTYVSPGSGRMTHVLGSRFVQATPASTTSPGSGRMTHVLEATLTNEDPPAVVTPPSGGGGTPPVDPGAGVIPTAQAGIPDGPFRGRGAKPRVTGRGG